MLNFNFKNCGFSKSALSHTGKKLGPYISDISSQLVSGAYDTPESFMFLANDSEGIADIKKLVKEKGSPRLKCVVVVGIGGSVAGTCAVAQAVKAKRDIIFIDSVDSDEVTGKILEIKKHYSGNGHCLFVIVSKSGETLETAANFSIIMELAKSLDNNWRKRFVFVTTPDSPLHILSKELGAASLLIRKVISGRFSVFSAVGLFPLAAAGVDIDRLLNGARHMLSLGLDKDIDKNPALKGSVCTYLNWKKGDVIFNNFIFLKRLEGLGSFLCDIMAESLGKDGLGLTPIVSVSSAALHSVGQLFFGGPRDKFTCFIYPEHFNRDLKTKSANGLSLGGLTYAILKGVLSSYRKNKLPYYEIYFGEFSEEVIGAAMQMKMMETVYLGKLMKVNAFNQPAVEDYKKSARKYL